MGRNWQLVTNRQLIYHGFCSQGTSKLKGYRDVAQMVERSLRMREVGDRCPASPKHFWGFDKSILFWLTIGKDWLLVTNRKLIYHEFCSEASSKLEEYGNVAEMAEMLCMGEVRGSMPRISKTFWGFDNSMWCLLIMGRNWQLVTNRKLIYHGFCSEASSTLGGYGDVAQTVERSLRMREVGDRCPASPKHFWGFDKSILFWLTIGKNWLLVTNRKLIYHEFIFEACSEEKITRYSKAWILFTSTKGYGDVAQMAEMARGGDRCPASPKHFWGFDKSILFWLTIARVTNRDFVQKLARSLKSTGT